LQTLAFIDVACDAGEEALPLIREFCKRDFEGNLGAALMQAGQLNGRQSRSSRPHSVSFQSESVDCEYYTNRVGPTDMV
jgi:hypothetical protein